MQRKEPSTLPINEFHCAIWGNDDVIVSSEVAMSQYARLCGEHAFQFPNGLFWELQLISLSMESDGGEKMPVDIRGCCRNLQTLDKGMLVIECSGTLHRLHSANVGFDDRFSFSRQRIIGVQFFKGGALDVFDHADLELFSTVI